MTTLEHAQSRKIALRQEARIGQLAPLRYSLVPPPSSPPGELPAYELGGGPILASRAVLDVPFAERRVQLRRVNEGLDLSKRDRGARFVGGLVCGM